MPLCPHVIPRCEDSERSTDLLTAARNAYVHAVGALTTRMGTMEESAYASANASVEMARADAEHARNALLKHRDEYGC
jgi:hypothetical protein